MSVATKFTVGTLAALIAVGAIFYSKQPRTGIDKEPRHSLHLSVGFSSVTKEFTETMIKVTVNGRIIFNDDVEESPWGMTIKVPMTAVVILTAEQDDALAMECQIFDDNGNVLDDNMIFNGHKIECKASLL